MWWQNFNPTPPPTKLISEYTPERMFQVRFEKALVIALYTMKDRLKYVILFCITVNSIKKYYSTKISFPILLKLYLTLLKNLPQIRIQI